METKVRDNIEYTLIRSSRKTISLQLRETGAAGQAGKSRETTVPEISMPGKAGVARESGEIGANLRNIKDVEVIVRAPRGMALKDIDAFAERHRSWIEQRTKQLVEARQNKREISGQEREEGVRTARIFVIF